MKWLNIRICLFGSFFYRSPSDYYVRLGDNDRTTNEGWEQNIKIKRTQPHPKYDEKRLNNDIALLELSRPAILNKRVGLVCLPPQNYDVSVKSNCYTTGKRLTSSFFRRLVNFDKVVLNLTTLDELYDWNIRALTLINVYLQIYVLFHNLTFNIFVITYQYNIQSLVLW